MQIPESPRVIYRKNPLDQVVCQLRFPRILRLEHELPTLFQERVRSALPAFEDTTEGVPLPIDLARALNLPGPVRVYRFKSRDERWVATLTSQFIALETRSYRRWEEFDAQLSQVIAAFVEIYRPAYFDRVGLRYVDLVVRSELGLGSSPWTELLEPRVLGELGSTLAPEAEVERASREVVVRHTDGWKLRIAHGLAKAVTTGEQAYVIDIDFFREIQTEVHDAKRALEVFNGLSGRLFRSCITQRLHDAMGPEPVPS